MRGEIPHLHVLGHASSKRCHGEFICAGGLCCKQLFHALATAPPYLATEVESNSLRSREVTLGTSRYQIPRSGLVQWSLWKVGNYAKSGGRRKFAFSLCGSRVNAGEVLSLWFSRSLWIHPYCIGKRFAVGWRLR